MSANDMPEHALAEGESLTTVHVRMPDFPHQLVVGPLELR